MLPSLRLDANSEDMMDMIYRGFYGNNMYKYYIYIYMYIHLFTGLFFYLFIEGNLEVKLPTIWTDGKAQPGRSSAMEKVRREKIRDETDQPWRKSEVRRSEMKKIRQDEKVGKSPNTVFFQCFVAPEGRQVGSLKRRVRRHLCR